ncbi:hypothetical protein [Alkalimarinus alittae]|uniref:Uncharacterized protein n=1 Tax=Alkalimarinus alittae TaxID=2961619 RepID=A0ABY6N028_9ALTE|nr:hypothetical protein [Alkalimarinus alittae]UZE95400.1 hypothetical protein NKI27_15195 [Alkalimarinus alittae]
MTTLWNYCLLLSLSLLLSACASNISLSEADMQRQYPAVSELQNQLSDAQDQ